jgi:ABC-type branched-subunit amino acid transport system ATPase component
VAVGVVGALGVTAATGIGPSSAAPRAGAPTQQSFNLGRGQAVAQGIKVDPRAAGLSLGITLTESLAGHQNTVAAAESRAINLGLIGTTLGAEGCDGGEPTLPPDQQPQSLRRDSTEPDAAGGVHEQESVPPGTPIDKYVRATIEPFAESITTGAPLPIPGVATIAGVVTNATSRIVNGDTRQARATTDIGSVQILFGVDFAVQQGEIVALLGPNGAGKSTLLKGICGLVKPRRGTVGFAGEDVTNLPADATTHRGISLMPSGKGVFPTLSVAENLRLAGWLIRDDSARLAAARREVEQLFPILRQRSSQMAGNLSGGEQQMLALGGALMTRPQLLMIDELSLGLAPTIVAQLLEVVREIHRRGTTIVIVEQSINVALQLAQRAVFMEKGEVRFEGPTSELLERPDILRSVFISGAGSLDDVEPADPESVEAVEEIAEGRPPIPDDAPVLLECRDVAKRFGGITAVDHVDLHVRDGEIVGLIGHNGAGKTTLMDCISGFNAIESGRILLRGTDVTDWAPYERAKGALGRSFQDALLYPTLTAAETIAVARERHLASRDMVAAAFGLPACYESELAVQAKVDELIELMGLGAFRDKLTGELSTGSRRIVDLACILAQEPKVLMLDEPSGGVAQKETEALGPLVLRVREHTGCSVLVIEHDMPLLSSICDRMVALELGAVIAEGTPSEVLEHPRVIESYLGTDESAINRSGAQRTSIPMSRPSSSRATAGNGHDRGDGRHTSTSNGNGRRAGARRTPLRSK